MGTFLVYIIKSAFCMTLLYLPYTLLLRREKLHCLNRLVLLAILVTSFLLPAVREEWFGGVWMSWQSAVPDGAYASFLGQLGGTGMRLPELVVTPDPSVPWWPVWLVSAYFFGVAVSLAVRLGQLARLLWFIPHGCLWKERREDGITLYCHARPVLPFSWMRSIVVSEADWEGTEARAVYQHEKAHVTYGHSWDTLLMLAAEVLQWFSPVVWMMEADMRCIHEYQADDYVLRQGINAKNYQLYLIKKAVGSRLQSFANGLNQSTLKKRIAMMCNKKSNKWAALKYMYLLPVGAFATVAFAHPEFTNQVNSRLGAVSAVKVTDLSATRHAVAAENVQPESLKMRKTAVKAENPGMNAIASLSVMTDTATVSSERTPDDVVVSSMIPRNKKGDIDMKESDVRRAMRKNTASFRLRQDIAKVMSRKVYDVVDVMPSFPGGKVECMAYIARNVKYPAECLSVGVTGRVLCSLVIDTDGSLCSIEAEEDSYARLLDGKPASNEMLRLFAEEAFRVISGMPKWTPGQKDGKAVATRFYLPITFQLK